MNVARMVTMLALAAVLVAPVRAQEQVPTARPADVASEDAIIAALYDVISGPAGQKRDWDRFRSLFVPGARLIPTGKRADGTVRHTVMTPEEYITTSGVVLESRGFFEKELARTSESYGNITHAFSTYASYNTAADTVPIDRGINSIQLLNDGRRWWIVSIFWDSERSGTPLPSKYLSSQRH